MSKSKVFVVDHENQANYQVYFVDHENQQRNHQIIANGMLVKHATQADVKVFICKYLDRADICIMRKNFPK